MSYNFPRGATAITVFVSMYGEEATEQSYVCVSLDYIFCKLNPARKIW